MADNNKISEIDAYIGLFQKTAISLLILLYLSGFIVLNSHLYEYGFVDYALFTKQYIYSGLLYLLSIAFSLIGSATALYFIIDPIKMNSIYPNSTKKGNALKHIIGVALAIVLPPFLLSIAYMDIFLSYNLPELASLGMVSVLFLQFILMILKIKGFIGNFIEFLSMIIITYFFLKILQLNTECLYVSSFITRYSLIVTLFFLLMIKDNIPPKIATILGILVIVVMFLTSTVQFGKMIYPHINRNLGGGRLAKVTVAFNKDSILSNQKTDSYYLIYDSSNDYYILKQNQTVFKINSRDVLYMAMEQKDIEFETIKVRSPYETQ